ncbi:uncharacterized protein LOC144453435 [Glandiceps talaboti]
MCYRKKGLIPLSATNDNILDEFPHLIPCKLVNMRKVGLICILVLAVLLFNDRSGCGGHSHNDQNEGPNDHDANEQGTGDAATQGREKLLRDVESLKFMISPEDFLQRYVSKRTPVLIKGVVKHWPAYTRWTEEYLSDVYDEEPVTNDEYYQHENDNVATMTMRDFFQNSKENGIRISQKAHPLLNSDIIMPTCLRCNGRMFQTPFKTDILLGNGRDKSVLHVEDKDFLLCAIKGNQAVTLISPLHSEELYADEGNPIGVSPIDATAVDLEKYPRARNIDALNVIVEEGDMLYIPHLWWHQFSLEDGQHHSVKISWSLTKEYIKHRQAKAEQFVEKKTEDMLSFSNVLVQYEKWMQALGSNAERPQCQGQDSLMSEYSFESSRDETHDDKDLTEDEACYFDGDNPKSPCEKDLECMEEDNELRCTKYVLDYCYHWEDRGCVTDLPQSLNRLSSVHFDELQDIQSSFLP